MVGEEQIKKMAYAIWEQEGRPEGKGVEHYFRAKQILEQQEAGLVIELGPAQPTIRLAAVAPAVQLAPPQPIKFRKSPRPKKR